MNRTERRTSIQDIMNQMAGRMDSLLDACDHAHASSGPNMLDEVRLWVSVDPLLADLHKQYLDARINHTRVRDKHGSRDPITDIASDMEDSTQCAVETRLIELRQSAEAKALLQAIIRKAHAVREDELVAVERARSSRYWKQFALRKASRATARGQNSFFMMIIGLLMLQQLTDQASLHLHIADIFSRVSGANRRLAAS
jgi:hypothetical protein